MACEVKTYGKILDFQKVQEFFGLSHDEHWLNALHYSVSPTGELIALAQGEKLALLSSYWDNKHQVSTYAMSWSGELEDPNQIITSVLCLPMYGKSVSTGAEWTCIALGLHSGMVLFYTDAGIKIFSQSCHEEAVLCIKAYSPPRHSGSDAFVYIIYDECICILKGAELFPLLANMRHNLSRTFGRSASAQQQLSLETADLLKFQKFTFSRKRETIINDAVIAGSQYTCTYDHLIEQAVGIGYYAKVMSSPIQSSVVVGIGAEPYLGFYYAEEGYRTTSLGEVAKDMIGFAYKSVFDRFFSRPANVEESAPAPKREIPMRTRCRFYDGTRDGFSIVIAPDGCLAAVTDNLNRVMLVDVHQGIVLRVWKGYRDAQCAFMPVKEKTLKGVQTHRRKALFLIIYAPRLGCLEIWALQNGPKAAAFTVSKNGQLAYNTHGLMGVPMGAKTKASTSCCLFLDSSDSSVKEIQIPFHYALSENNSKTSRDIHLLRRLKYLLKETESNDNLADICTLAEDFQTVEVRQQCLEMLKKNKQLKPQIFQAIVNAFSNSLRATDADPDVAASELKHFKTIVNNYKRLADFYIAMKAPTEAEFDEHLELDDCDLVIINQIVLLLGGERAQGAASSEDATAAASGKVTFQERHKEDGDFVDYLSIFQVDREDSVPLLKSKAYNFGYVSGRLFSEFFDRGLCFEEFKTAAENAKIPCDDLMLLALHFWIEKPFEYQNCDEVTADMSRLAAMIHAICELAGDCVNNYAYNAISPWWQAIREQLLESPKSLGLLVAIICKTVAKDEKRSYREGSCDEGSQTEDEEKWEKISHDEAQWGLLIGKLEDISILGAITEYPLESLDPMMPEWNYELPDCSLKFIVNGGKGIVTDLIAQWLINARIHPSKIVEIENVEVSTTQQCDKTQPLDTPAADEGGGDVERTAPTATIAESHTSNVKDPVLEKLALLREHFPFSLESGMLLSLMSWHYMVKWSKNLPRLEYMRAAMTCLSEFKKVDYALKHGMCCMIWNATLKFPLQSTMRLIQKAGRLPKDKMCQQDIEMSAAAVPEFLEQSLVFLEHFAGSLEHDKLELKFEESLTAGPLPLQFLALQQHNAIKELLQLHYELCAVLHFIAVFQLKIPKPITAVFDAMSNKAFFSDINKELNFLLTTPDLVLQQHREHFLCKVITGSMDLIREDLEQLYVQEHLEYMEKVLALADSWKLSRIALIRHQVVEMYAHGYDAHGEARLKQVEDDEHIGRLLLEVAGKRMNLYASASRTAFLKIASVGQQLLQYLDRLRDAPANFVQITAADATEIELVALTKLVTHSFECLSRQGTKYVHIAAQMFDACSVLDD